jgi:hypothetical protein
VAFGLDSDYRKLLSILLAEQGAMGKRNLNRPGWAIDIENSPTIPDILLVGGPPDYTRRFTPYVSVDRTPQVLAI